MYINRNIHWKIIARFAWANILFFILWAGLVTFAFHFFEHQEKDISIPFLPLSTIGIAVAFYLGFKNNASYDRFWEARKIWGGIVNYSRTWSIQVLGFISTRHATRDFSEEEIKEIQQQLIYRHIAWINALRHNLRRPSSFSITKRLKTAAVLSQNAAEKEHWDEEVGAFLDPAEYQYVLERKNTPTHIISRQSEQLQDLMEKKGLIDDFRHMEMMRVQEEFYNLQGKCERIKNTPFPRQYAYFSKIFTWIFVLLLPFGMVGAFNELNHATIWLNVPVCVLVSWIFITMEMVGDNSEDPFENFTSDVPMTALCRTIEIDLREMLGETDLPPKTQAIQGILF